MVRYGKDDQDTHESMQMKRLAAKYEPRKMKRHAGENRMTHKGDDKPMKPAM